MRMIVVALYLWFPCRWLGKAVGVEFEEPTAGDKLLSSIIGALIHVLGFGLFLLCGGYKHFSTCVGH